MTEAEKAVYSMWKKQTEEMKARHDRETFMNHLSLASALVATWPEWKQNILSDALSPTVRVPREPMDNSRATEWKPDAAPALPPRDETNWIQSFSGKQVWPANMHADDIDIRDIAHALSMKCRYTGHSKFFYSVAQHSVLMSRHYSKSSNDWMTRQCMLMHDATEAYLPDVARPLKKLLPDFKAMEDRLEKIIAKKFDLIYPWPQEVKKLDLIMLATERRDLMATPPIPWISTENVATLPEKIESWPPEIAKREFLREYSFLFGEGPS